MWERWCTRMGFTTGDDVERVSTVNFVLDSIVSIP
jgi:hypothetical protein